MTLNDIENDYQRLSDKFDSVFDGLIDAVELNGKSLKEALKTQLPLQLEMETLSKRANYLQDNIDILVDDEFGKAISAAMKDGYRSVTINEAKLSAASNTSYKHAKRTAAKVRRLKDEIKGCLEVVNSRKYTLHAMTNALVAGVDNIIL